MSAHYSLTIGEVELGAANTIFVVADFDNGAWINCRVVSDQRGGLKCLKWLPWVT